MSRSPMAYARISNISEEIHGVFEANPDGSLPDVELKSERLVPLYNQDGHTFIRLDTRGRKR